MAESFYDLEAYKKSYDIALKLQEIVQSLPESEQYDLAEKIRATSRGIPACIAEGYRSSKSSSSEYKKTIQLAIGMTNEIMVWLDFCRDLQYIEPEVIEPIKKDYANVEKMLRKLISNWFFFKK